MRFRPVLACAIALGVCATLAGCSPLIPLITTLTNQSNGSAVVPAIGDCWHADFDTIDSESTWTSGRPVDCSSAHQSYTYSIETLPKTLTGDQVDSKTGYIRDDIDTAAGDLCTGALARFLPLDIPYENRLEPGYFVPTPDAWAAGARWVRCDVALIAYGSSFDAPRLERLPNSIATFVDKVKAAPGSIALCIDTKEAVEESDPFTSDTARYADCAGDPQWKEASESDLPGDDSAPFPSEKARNAFDQATCGDAADAAGQVWVTYEPTKDSWKYGDRTVECWVASGASGASGASV